MSDDVTELGTLLAGEVDGRVDELAAYILASDWLAQHDARIRAEALREAATPTGSEVSRRLLNIGHSPEIAGTAAALTQRALRNRADRIVTQSDATSGDLGYAQSSAREDR